ncbi:phage tail protein [Sphingobium sp. MI1205]|uniref:phage tail protein n=1 Tax=Sphingobium sp. MI1205 TaxID=407020 RepID=UPI00077027FD|nr:phage tail protein [Sphingobium sp. MI1205]AMK19326.1 hypothetical protein K663_14740 [Sphingobium sp. MI1205]
MSIDPVSLAVTAALTAGQMALQMTNKIEGPRLDSLDVTVADYGTPLNYFYGTRRFSAVPIIWAEPIREVKRKSKTKGGKHTEYSYFGSWAVVVADHEIDRVTRIWFDKHLVYDITGPGPIQVFNIGTTSTTNKGKGTRTTNIQLTEHLRIYLGTEDQEADPRMLADVESKHGANSCPHYKGVAYIVFEEIPLEKFGNRIPQISVEAQREESHGYPYESFPVTVGNNRLWNTCISADGTKLAWFGNDRIELWHLPSRTRLRTAPAAGIGVGEAGMFSTGAAALLGDGGIRFYSVDGVFTGSQSVLYQDGLRVVQLPDGSDLLVTFGQAFITRFYTFGMAGLAEFFTTDFGDLSAWTVRACCVDSYGDVWVSGSIAGFFDSWDDLYLLRISNISGRTTPGFAHLNTGTFYNGGATSFAHYDGHFVVHWGHDYLIKIDDETLSIVDTVAMGGDVYSSAKQWGNLAPGSSSIWLNYSEVSLSDLSVIRTVNGLDWKFEDADGILYSSNLHALLCWPQYDATLTIRYLDRPGDPGTTLEAVIMDVSERCGLDLADVDASELTQRVNYSWTQGSGRDILEPLLDVHDSIVRPHDFGLEFIKLGRASLGSMDVEDFVTDSGPRARYDMPRELDTDLPRRVSVNYSDLTADQQPNNAADQIPLDVTDSVRELSLNLTTLALMPDDAQQLTERWLRRRWYSREGYKFVVTSQMLKIEPGDVYDLDFDGIAKRGRVKAMTIEKRGAVQIEMKRDDPLVATLSTSTGQIASGHVAEVLLVPMPTRAFIIDTTYVVDADDAVSPFLTIGAGPAAEGAWLGAAFYEARDGVNYDAEVANVPSYFPATWGYCTAALNDVETCSLWDRGAGVNVMVPGSTLSSITEAEANADPTLNRLIFESGEQVQFTTATLESDGSYTLTGFKRGRRGTEWATDLHAAGECFILPDSTLKMTRGASDIARTLYFKALGSVDVLDNATPITFTYDGRTHKPYAPCHLHATKDVVTGDWTITWVRRTRLGGAWTGGGAIPLGEATEAYELVVLDGADEKRVISITSPSATYTAAQQVADFGAELELGELALATYQLSDLAGRGFATVGTF